MKSAIAAFVAAILVTALLTPLVRRIALAVGAVDEPGARRVHTRRVPRLGGIAIILGFFLPLVGLFVARTQAGLIFFAAPRVTAGLLGGSALVLTAGLIDDIKGMGAKAKLLMQIGAATAAFAGGMRIESVQFPGLGAFNLGVIALPATVLWIVGIVNAINLIDGLDGLAAGVSFLACLTNFTIASLTGNVYIFLVTASLGGAVIGFLFHNFNPARIFMGDSGSMFLGFILACASLLGAGTQKSPTLIAIVAPIVALGLPIMDMLLTVARRFLERRSIFGADRGHIHHRLLDMGLTHRRAVLSLYLLSIAFTVVALVVYFGRSWEVGAALFALTALLVAVVRFVGYFGSSLGLQLDAEEEKTVDALRRSVPHVLRRMLDASSVERLPEILSEFGMQSGLLAIRVVNDKSAPLQRWSWEFPPTNPHSGAATPHEAVCASFRIPDGDGAVELNFFLGTPVVGPQVRILLQLVADGAEALLASSQDVSVGVTIGRERLAQNQG